MLSFFRSKQEKKPKEISLKNYSVSVDKKTYKKKDYLLISTRSLNQQGASVLDEPIVRLDASEVTPEQIGQTVIDGWAACRTGIYRDILDKTPPPPLQKLYDFVGATGWRSYINKGLKNIKMIKYLDGKIKVSPKKNDGKHITSLEVNADFECTDHTPKGIGEAVLKGLELAE